MWAESDRDDVSIAGEQKPVSPKQRPFDSHGHHPRGDVSFSVSPVSGLLQHNQRQKISPPPLKRAVLPGAVPNQARRGMSDAILETSRTQSSEHSEREALLTGDDTNHELMKVPSHFYN